MFDDAHEGSPSRGFECNICLDLAHDPVVTFCGHLYCWPCIYKWIQLHNITSENRVERHPQCPVCKTQVSETTLVPLYGRGHTTNPSEVEVPERPPSLRRGGGHALIATTGSHSSQQLHHRVNPLQPQTHHLNSRNVLHPMIGETAYAARVSGNVSSMLYAYPNLYHLASGSSSSLRMRRQELHADNSLGRLYIFLFCCVVICLIFL